MIIEKTSKTNVGTFGTLKNGDCFSTAGDIYMKVEYREGGNIVTWKINSVNFRTGYFAYFGDDEVVTPEPKAKLIW